MRQFDVARHQPHPPGYPVFIALAKAVHAAGPSEPASLALLSVSAATLGVFTIAAWCRALGGVSGPTVAIVTAVLTIASPLYWFTANRPLSDMAGLTAVVAVQALILAAKTDRGLAIASFCAAAAVGLRSQAFWLTTPLLVWAVVNRGWRPIRAAVAYAVGLAAWGIPLVAVSGGLRAYWHAVSNQGAEDLGGIRMFWTTPTLREGVDALYYAFIAPWAVWPIAATVLLLASIGVVTLWRRSERALAVVAAGFGPYLIFDVLFQETFTSRYALPLVPPVAFLAASGALAMTRPRYVGVAAAMAAAIAGAHIGGVSLAAYARQPAPAFRLLADMGAAGRAVDAPPVLGMDRREALDLRRPMQWVGAAMPAIAGQLPSRPQHEWLSPVKYWNDGGAAPVWFVADPERTDIDLIGHAAPVRYRWLLPYPVLMSGTRPNEMDWYRIDVPRWYIGEGWALTPEAAGVTAARRGDADPRRLAWIAADSADQSIAIGGRNFSRTTTTIDIDSTLGHVGRFVVSPGFFARILPVPHRTAPVERRFERLDVDVGIGGGVALEQFDVSTLGHPIAVFGNGWHEQEYNPVTGLRWRWMSNSGDLLVTPAPGPIALRLEGESPRKYFERGSRLVVRAANQVLFDQTLSADFSLTIPIARQQGLVTLETDQTYVPAARSRRTKDHRALGLRIFKCEVAPLTAPASGPGK